MYSKIILFASILALVVSASYIRNKREAYILPDGVELYLSSVSPNFQCTAPGYYADIANNCQLFHVCIPQEFPDGRNEIAQYTFACGNQTVFNQFSLTCAHESEAIPCASSADFFYLNERIGKENEYIHNAEDVERAAAYTAVPPQ